MADNNTHVTRMVAEGAAQYIADLRNAGKAEKDFGAASAAFGSQVGTVGKAAAQAAQGVAELAKATRNAEKIESLNVKLATQGRELKLLQTELAETVAKYGEGSAAAQRKALAVDKLTASIDANAAALSRQKKEQAQQTTETPAAAGGFRGLFEPIEGGASRAEGAVRSVAGSVIAMAGAFGIATTATEVATFAFDQFKTGLSIRAQLEQNTASIGLFVGGAERANQVMTEAQTWGKQYAFTQSEIGAALQALGPLLSQSTAAIGTQVEVYSRLATLNPAEGLEGAAVAIRELVSGDTVSLVERFNVAKNEATAMRDAIAGGADVVSVLNTYLNNTGVTVAALEARTQGITGNFNRAAVAVEQLQLALAEGKAGELYAGLVEGAATSAAAVVTLGDKVEDTGAKLLESAESYEEYAQTANAINGQVDQAAAATQAWAQSFGPLSGVISAVVGVARDLGGTIPALSQAQFDYAKSLQASGLSASEVQAKVSALAPTFDTLATAQQLSAAHSNEAGAAFAALTPRLTEIASSSAYGQAAVENLSMAYARGSLDSAELTAAIALLEAQMNNHTVAIAADNAATAAYIGFQAGATAATDEAAIAAQNAEIAALNESLAKETSAIQGDLLAVSQQNLMAAARDAAAGQGDAHQASAALASQFGVEESQVYRLIVALRQLSQYQNTGISLGVKPGTSLAIRDEVIGNQGRPMTADQIRAAREANQAVANVNAEWDARRAEMLRQSQAASRTGRRGGGGGGGGGAARAAGGGAASEVKAAEKAGESLASIRQKTGDRIAQIQQAAGQKLIALEQATQDKLKAIDQRVADERAKIAQQLADNIVKSNAATEAAFQLNDLEQYDKDITDERKKELAEREKAEATYRQRVAQAQQEARQMAANGDAEYARAYLDAKTQEAADLMSIEQEAAKARANVSGGQSAALEADIQEAIAARQRQTQVDIDLANAASQQRAQAVEDEKAQVLSDAAEQQQKIVAEAQAATGKIIDEATKQAGGVKNATAQMVADATAGWAEIAAQIDQSTDAVDRYNAAVGSSGAPSGGGSSAAPTAPTQAAGGGTFAAGRGIARHIGAVTARAAGGGTFMANKPMKVLVGEAGPEMIHVAPLIPGGKTTVGAGWAKMAGGGAGVAYWQQQIEQERQRQNSMQTGGSSFDITQINPTNLDSALQQMHELSRIVNTWARRNTNDPGITKKFADTVTAISNAIRAAVELRTKMQDLGPPLDQTAVDSLVEEVGTVADHFQGEMSRHRLNVGMLSAYTEGFAAVMDSVRTMAEARSELRNLPPPVTEEVIRSLAVESRMIIRIVQSELVRLWQEERDALATALEALESSTGLLSNVAAFRQDVADLGPPLMLERLQELAAEANQVVALLRGHLTPQSVEARSELEAFGANVQQTVDTLKAILDLRSALTETRGPLDPEKMRLLLDDTRAVATIAEELVPEGYATVDGLEAYAETAERVASLFTAMAELRATLNEAKGPIPTLTIIELASEISWAVQHFQTIVRPMADDLLVQVEAYGTVAQTAIDTFLSIAELQSAVTDIGAPISFEALNQLSWNLASGVMYFVRSVQPVAQQTVDEVERYGQVAQTAVDTLSSFAGLGADIEDAVPIRMSTVEVVAAQLMGVVEVFTRTIQPVAQQLNERAERYSGLISNAIDSLSAGAGLGEELRDFVPIRRETVEVLAAQLIGVVEVFTNTIQPIAEQLVERSDRYTSLVGNAIDSIMGALDLGQGLRSFTPIPIDLASRAADDAQRVAGIFIGRMLPAAQEQADAAERINSIIGSATGSISSVLGIGQELFKGYTSPSDAMWTMVFADANEVIERTYALADIYKSAGKGATTEVIESFGTMVQALGGMKDLVFSLNPGANYTMNDQQIAQFEITSGLLMGVVGRLAAQAASIPMAGIDSISALMQGASSVVDVLGKGGSINWGNISMPQSQQSVQPAMSAQQIANNYYYDQSNNVSVGSIGSGLTMGQVKQAINEALVESGRTAYTRQRMA